MITHLYNLVGWNLDSGPPRDYKFVVPWSGDFKMSWSLDSRVLNLESRFQKFNELESGFRPIK